MGRYHWLQNHKGQIGGEISLAKTLWLGLAMFFYIIFSVWWLFKIPTDSVLYPIALLVVSFFYFRLIVQSFLMFTTKNWTTAHGITFNAIGCLLLTGSLFFVMQTDLLERSTLEMAFLCYLVMLIAFQVTDSFYAYKFGKIVGNATKGDQAIWFASKASKFKKINQITAILNTVYLVLSVVLIGKIVTL